jgi:hypothetical protein
MSGRRSVAFYSCVRIVIVARETYVGAKEQSPVTNRLLADFESY